jgi:hypothetical protein
MTLVVCPYSFHGYSSEIQGVVGQGHIKEKTVFIYLKNIRFERYICTYKLC